MPSKKAKPRPGPSLKDCIITFASNSIPADALGGKSLADVKAEISSNGGQYVTKVNDCTHLVATNSQFQKQLTKIQSATAQPDVKIVSYEWLDRALSSSSPIDEKLFDLRNQSQNAPTTNGNTSKDEDEKDSKTAASKKRKRDQDDHQGPCRSQGDGKAMNVTKKLDVNIPLDDVLVNVMGSHYKVYIDGDSTIFDATLNQSDSGKNANKFYRMQLLKDTSGQWHTWTRWGRVGEDGQFKLLGDGSFDLAMAEFEKKFKDKTGNTWAERATGPMRAKKYVFIERSYEDSDSEDEDDLPGADKRKKIKKEDEEDLVQSSLPEPVQRLLKLIFNQEYFDNTYADYNYDAKKMPLGKLSKNSINRGYAVLKDLSSVVSAPGINREKIETLSNQYLSLIPHVVPRSSKPDVIDTMDKIKRETDLIASLSDMLVANDLMKGAKKSQTAEEVSVLDRQYAGLGMEEMTPLERSSTEFKNLEAYLTKSVGHTHGTRYTVQDIFRIERNGEHSRFESSEYSKISNKNRRLLWHGSRATNFGGILSQGLRIAPPEAPVNGYMFGKGVYLADMSSKSAGYTCAYSSGGNALLLLCEAELGEPPLKLTGANYNAGDEAKKKGLHSTWGVGRTAPQAWKDAGVVHESLKGIKMPDVVSKPPGATNESGAYLQYNEYIVYDVAQIRLRYLFRVTV